MTFRILFGVKVCRHKELPSVVMHVFFDRCLQPLRPKRKGNAPQLHTSSSATALHARSLVYRGCPKVKLLRRLGLLGSWYIGGVLGLALGGNGWLAGWLGLGGSPQGL